MQLKKYPQRRLRLGQFSGILRMLHSYDDRPCHPNRQHPNTVNGGQYLGTLHPLLCHVHNSWEERREAKDVGHASRVQYRLVDEDSRHTWWLRAGKVQLWAKVFARNPGDQDAHSACINLAKGCVAKARGPAVGPCPSSYLSTEQCRLDSSCVLVRGIDAMFTFGIDLQYLKGCSRFGPHACCRAFVFRV